MDRFFALPERGRVAAAAAIATFLAWRLALAFPACFLRYAGLLRHVRLAKRSFCLEAFPARTATFRCSRVSTPSGSVVEGEGFRRFARLGGPLEWPGARSGPPRFRMETMASVLPAGGLGGSLCHAVYGLPASPPSPPIVGERK